VALAAAPAVLPEEWADPVDLLAVLEAQVVLLVDPEAPASVVLAVRRQQPALRAVTPADRPGASRRHLHHHPSDGQLINIWINNFTLDRRIMN
jgi:hypothetical protein